jgi:cytochrome c553
MRLAWAGFLGMLIALPVAAQGTSRLEYREALDLEPDIERGRRLYASCTGCHQVDGSGLASRHIPGIAGQHYRVLIEQLAHFRAGERPEERMKRFAEEHQLKGPQDLADVSAFVANLPSTRTSVPGPSIRLAAGARIYAEHCSRCHGEHGEGDPVVRFPRLAGQHYGYLLRQLDALRLRKRDRRNEDHKELLTPLSRSQMRGLAASLARMSPASVATPAP